MRDENVSALPMVELVALTSRVACRDTNESALRLGFTGPLNMIECDEFDHLEEDEMSVKFVSVREKYLTISPEQSHNHH